MDNVWILIFVGIVSGLLCYILGCMNPFCPFFGSIVIEQSEDQNERDKISFMFDKELEDLYSAKTIKLKVVKVKREKSNSDNDEKLN